MSNTLMFSVFSGTFYEIPTEDVLLVDMGHLPLNSKPRTNCKKCHGMGYLGRESQNLTYRACLCVQKVINFSILKEIENKYSKLS
jgi:hypothetical protein